MIGTSLLVMLTAQSLASGGRHEERPICSNTASVLKAACYYDTKDDLLEAVAICMNDKRSNRCKTQAYKAVKQELRDCQDVYKARLELCGEIGEAPYQPEFGEEYAEHFVNPLLIGRGMDGDPVPNPYFPLIPGNYWVYEGTFTEEEDDGSEVEVTERITVEVTNQTKLIDGITCIVVIDTAEVDGEAVEITNDWYAQKKEGDVYYCGEISENFEVFEGDVPEEPELVDIEGSWKHARDGAKAGVLLPFTPVLATSSVRRLPGETPRKTKSICPGWD